MTLRPVALSCLLLALLVLTGAITAPAAHARGDTIAKVDAFLRERAKATKSPGLAYAIVNRRAVGHVGTIGRDGDGQPVTKNTPFLWGSVAKPVTATAVMTLVEAGKVDLDQPVRAYLPHFTLADPQAASRITVRHLLTQTSGIPEFTDAVDRFEQRADPYRAAMAELADVEPASDPGQRHSYSSANYLLLGALVEDVSGRPYAQYLRAHVLNPLGMRDAITTPKQAHAIPAGHDIVFGRAVETKTRFDQTGPSYGYLGGTVEDLAHFAVAHLNNGAYGPNQLLTRRSVTEMHRGTALVGGTQKYSLGWRDDARNADLGTRTIWHSGASPGYQATVVLLPGADRAFVVMHNVHGYFQGSDLTATGLGAARILVGGQPNVPAADTSYHVILAVLVSVLALAAAEIAWSVYRLFRPASKPRSRLRLLTGTAGWTLGGIGLAWLAKGLVPLATGADQDLIRLWAPDIGWLLLAIIIAGYTLAAVRLAEGCLRLRPSRLRVIASEHRQPSRNVTGQGL